MADMLERNGLQAFFTGGLRLDIGRKQTIIRLDEDDSAVYWIAQGFVKTCSFLSDGTQMCLHIYRPSEVFPVMNVVGAKATQLPNTVEMTAYTDCVLYRRQRQEVLAYLDRHPRAILQVLRQQTQVYNPMINLHLASAEQKVVFHLLYLARRFGEAADGFTRIALPFTQQEFADSINVSRETTGKILGRLEADLYLMRGRRYAMVHMERLEALRQQIA